MTKKLFHFALGLSLTASLMPNPAMATHFTSIVRGRILLDVENHGEAWYMYPVDLRRYYLGRAEDAYNIMRFLSLGITNTDLAKIPTGDQTITGDLALRRRLSGLILLQVQAHGEAWYVYPGDLKRYYLGRADDAFRIMTQFGLGISNTNLAHIPIGTINQGLLTQADHKHQSYALTTENGTFNIEVVTLRQNKFDLLTDTAEVKDCNNNCAAKPLDQYVNENSGIIGIHGTYFCPPDYAPCANEINTYFSPVYNSEAKVMINEHKLKFHSGPLLAYGANGQMYYYHRANQFGDSVQAFESRTGTKLAGAIANYPSLIENGVVVVNSEPMDDNQRNLKGVRGAIGFNGEFVFLVIARSATVPDMASILKALGATNAMNLDGGASAALHYLGSYKFGPGRLLPNAIIFKQR